MKSLGRFLLPLVCAAAFLPNACKKAETTAGTSTETAAATAPSKPPTAVAEVATSAQPNVETTAKLAAADWALKQEEIKNDPNGQWALSATASSSYSVVYGPEAEQYSAKRATGPPDVEQYGADDRAWTSKEADAGIEWLELSYAKPVHATEVRIRESGGSGGVIKVELLDEPGNAHTAWQGTDPTTKLNYLIVKFPRTDYKVNRLKLTLATNVAPDWQYIDAVQLVGTE